MKKHLFFIIYTIILLSSAALSALGTFVIPKNLGNADIFVPDSDDNTTCEENDVTENTNEVIYTDNSYKDQNIEITITQLREYETEIYVAEIKINNFKLHFTTSSSTKYLLTTFSFYYIIFKHNLVMVL